MYKTTASVYDLFMDKKLYDEWIEYILKLWKRHRLRPKLVLDLCCGTGNITHRLAERGYEMIGVDISPDMLMRAQRKSTREVLFLNQDAARFELYGTVDAIVCLCDSVNHIIGKKQLLSMFKQVYTYLNPGGLLIFDINTSHRFERDLAYPFCGLNKDSAFIIESSCDSRKKIMQFVTTFFIKEPGGYKRKREVHYERVYKIGELCAMLKKTGLKPLAVYNDRTFTRPDKKSGRVFFVVRRP